MGGKTLKEMSFLDHLEELRWLLVRSTVAVIIMATATYFVSDYVFNTLIFGPTDPNFFTYTFFVIYPINLDLQIVFASPNCLSLFKTPIWKDK